MKQLEKQQKKLAAKGIHVEIESLRKDYDAQKAGGAADGTGIGGGNGKFDHHHFDARSVDAEIDVVGDDELGRLDKILGIYKDASSLISFTISNNFNSYNTIDFL